MDRFQNDVQMFRAVESRAIPALERIAANEALHERSLARFARDDPPPYESSTESSTHENDFLAPSICAFSDIPEPLREQMDEPLDDKEREMVASAMCGTVLPMALYQKSVAKEAARIDCHLIPRAKMWQGRMGQLRLGIVARHCVKRSWQALGVWNPRWGMPGRNTEAGDDAAGWQWPWQPPRGGTSQRTLDPDWSYERRLALRALDLRRGLRRGEHAPVIPQSHLPPNATAAQAEAFLISRPWFVFAVEVAEERRRLQRVWDVLCGGGRGQEVQYSPLEQVIAWWKERGDWRSDYFEDYRDPVGASGWKWRHESPSPEPEDGDFVAVDSMVDQPLDAHPDRIEFTPSEVDALEEAEGPEAEESATFWRFTAGISVSGYPYPGQWGPLRPIPVPAASSQRMPSIFDKVEEESDGMTGLQDRDSRDDRDDTHNDDDDDHDDHDDADAGEPSPAVLPDAAASPLAPRRSARIAARNNKRAAEEEAVEAAEAARDEQVPAKRQRRMPQQGTRGKSKTKRTPRSETESQRKTRQTRTTRPKPPPKAHPARPQRKSMRSAGRRRAGQSTGR